jgi:hypothetical protein
MSARLTAFGKGKRGKLLKVAFDKSFDPESFDFEITTEGLTTEGLPSIC